MRVLGVVVLMIALGRVEHPEWLNARNDLPLEFAGRFPSGLGGFGRSPLVIAVVEDGRAILRPDIRTLPVLGGGIVGSPEHVQQALIGDDSRIVFDLHAFGMAGPPAGDFPVGWDSPVLA